MKQLVARVLADPRYSRNVEYGHPRPGHPEGTVKAHIAELEANLDALKPRLADAHTYWTLQFLIHVHDTFKADATRGVPILDPHSHASLAKLFAAELTDDRDLLNMIQFHDENYALWQQVAQTGSYDRQRFHTLLATIQDWNLFLLFLIVDGCTAGKERAKLVWFIQEVKRYKHTVVDQVLDTGTDHRRGWRFMSVACCQRQMGSAPRGGRPNPRLHPTPLRVAKIGAILASRCAQT